MNEVLRHINIAENVLLTTKRVGEYYDSKHGIVIIIILMWTKWRVDIALIESEKSESSRCKVG